MSEPITEGLEAPTFQLDQSLRQEYERLQQQLLEFAAANNIAMAVIAGVSNEHTLSAGYMPSVLERAPLFVADLVYLVSDNMTPPGRSCLSYATAQIQAINTYAHQVDEAFAKLKVAAIPEL